MSDAGKGEARAWLRKALDDLRAPGVDLEADPALLEDAVFHCQQASEKLFKAFLTAHDRGFRKTHDLDILGEECIGLDPSLEPEASAVAELSVFAGQFRYPVDSEPPTRPEAEDTVQRADNLSKAIRLRLRRYLS